mmetsp:Transcript_83458/g.194025  ORF Transcript_83458/g.194025 Transcript_83458/m.194025 type:complete len:488 (+) Transcript_83458:70-1533(+)
MQTAASVVTSSQRLLLGVPVTLLWLHGFQPAEATPVDAELCLLQTYSFARGGKVNESQGIDLTRSSSTASGLRSALPGVEPPRSSHVASLFNTSVLVNGAIAMDSNASRVPGTVKGIYSDGVQAALSIAVLAVSALVLFTAWALQRSTSQEQHHFDGREMDHIFDEIDVDGSGSLSVEEVKGYFKKTGRTVPDNQLRALIEMADEDKSGDLDREEFGILLSNIKDEGPVDLLRCLAAEWLGMFIFQFFGGMPDAGGLGNNVIVVALIYTFAPISGAHFNPCITAAVYFAKQITLQKACLYVVVQLLAAIEGVLLLRWLNVAQVSSQSGSPVVPCLYSPAELPPFTVFVLELMCTFTFLMVFLGVVVDSKSGWGNIAPIVMGVAGYGVAHSCGPLSGVSMNPSRFLAPCIVYGCFPDWKTSLAYVFSSLLAAIVAAFVYMRTFMDRPAPELHQGMANFQFMVSDNRKVKKQLAGHRASILQSRRASVC